MDRNQPSLEVNVAEDFNNPADPDSTIVEKEFAHGPKRRLYSFARAIYYAIPPRVRTLAQPVAVHSQLLKRLRPETWIIEGLEKHSELPFSVCLYVTTDQYKSYLETLIFGSSFRSRYLGQAWLWKAFKDVPEAAANCSLIIAEVHELHLHLMGDQCGIVIPAWIRGSADLPRAPEGAQRESTKKILRTIKKQEMEYEVASDQKSFDHFYDQMYVPHTRARHGATVHLSTRQVAKESFDLGELLLIKRQGEYVAGKLIKYEGDTAFVNYSGVQDGRMDLVHDGVLAAAMEFTLQHLEQRAFKTINFGQSRGFMNDGVLQFKKRYGQKIVSTSSHKFLLRVLKNTKASQAFLQNNPFMFEQAGKLHGAAFVSDREPPAQHTLDSCQKHFSYPGLSKLLVCALSPSEIEEPKANSPDSAAPRHARSQDKHLSQADGDGLMGQLGNIGSHTVTVIDLE
jgi:hypothetical protein